MDLGWTLSGTSQIGCVCDRSCVRRGKLRKGGEETCAFVKLKHSVLVYE